MGENERKNTYIINRNYKDSKFQNSHRQALFMILIKYYKEFIKNNRELPITDLILKRNKDYLSKSDELYNWFYDLYTKTDNNKDRIKFNMLYNRFKESDYYKDLSKAERRQNNYKHFIEKFQSNLFLKKNVSQYREKWVLTNHVLIARDDSESESDDED